MLPRACRVEHGVQAIEHVLGHVTTGAVWATIAQALGQAQAATMLGIP